MPNKFARAPGAGRRSGGQHRGRLPGRSDERSALANDGCAAIRAAWSGQPRNNVTRSRSRNSMVRRRLRVRLGEQRRAGDERGQQTAAEAAHPEERHRDVEALAPRDAARRESGRGGAQRAAVRVHHALGCAATAGGEEDDHVVGRTYRGFHRRHDRVPAPIARKLAVDPDTTQRRHGRMAPARGESRPQTGCGRLEVVEVATVPVLRHGDEMRDGGRAELRDQFRRAQQGAERHQDRADAHGRCGVGGPGDAVGHEQPDAITLHHAGRHETCARATRLASSSSS